MADRRLGIWHQLFDAETGALVFPLDFFFFLFDLSDTTRDLSLDDVHSPVGCFCLFAFFSAFGFVLRV